MSERPASFNTADLYDQYGERLQVCEPMFLDFGGHRAFHGISGGEVSAHGIDGNFHRFTVRPGPQAILISTTSFPL